MANEGREVNQSWDGVWYVKSRVVDDGWIAEIAIPFKTLKFPQAPVQTWGINFQRTIRTRNEDALWAPVPRIYNIQRVSLAGTLEGLKASSPARISKSNRIRWEALRRILRPMSPNKWDGDVGARC